MCASCLFVSVCLCSAPLLFFVAGFVSLGPSLFLSVSVCLCLSFARLLFFVVVVVSLGSCLCLLVSVTSEGCAVLLLQCELYACMHRTSSVTAG